MWRWELKWIRAVFSPCSVPERAVYLKKDYWIVR